MTQSATFICKDAEFTCTCHQKVVLKIMPQLVSHLFLGLSDAEIDTHLVLFTCKT